MKDFRVYSIEAQNGADLKHRRLGNFGRVGFTLHMKLQRELRDRPESGSQPYLNAKCGESMYMLLREGIFVLNE